MQQPDEYEVTRRQRLRDEKTAMIATMRKDFPHLNDDNELDVFEADGTYTLAFLRKIIAELRELNRFRFTELRASQAAQIVIQFTKKHKKKCLLNFLIVVTHSRYQHTDYWHPDVKEILLQACEYLSSEPVDADEYEDSRYHSNGLVDDYFLHGYTVSQADVWRQKLRFRFAHIRHIRQNTDYFRVSGPIRDTPYATNYKSLTTTILAAASFFDQDSFHTLTIGTYRFIKFIGHFVGYVRVKHQPAYTIHHMPDTAPKKIVTTAVRAQLRQLGYMTETTQLTDRAYLNALTHPTRIRRVNHEIENTVIRHYAPIDPKLGLYVITPTKLYYIDGQSMISGKTAIDFQFLVCKETDIICRMMRRLKITRFNHNYLLTAAESRIFFMCFKHQRYDPQFLEHAETIALAEAQRLFPQEDQRMLANTATPSLSQCLLNTSCFEIFAVTSFNPLHTIQLARQMVNALAVNDRIACAAVGSARFLQLRQLLTHTFEITALKIALQEEVTQNPRQYYAYTADISDQQFWQTLRSQAPNAYIWIEAPTGLYCVTDLDPSNPAQQPELVLPYPTHLLRRTVPQLAKLKERYQKKGSPVTANTAAASLHAAKILKLATDVRDRFLSANGPNKLIMHSTVSGGGHSFYTIFSKQAGEVSVTIVNGGSSEIRHHPHAESRPSGLLTDELHFARELNLSFTITNTSHCEILAHYLSQLMILSIASHMSRSNGTKPTDEQSIQNIYLTPDKPQAENMPLFGLGNHEFEVPAGQGEPRFRYPRQDTGNCTVHNLVNACICALGYQEGLCGGFHVVMNVFKYALDRLTTQFRQAPIVAAPDDPAAAGSADDGDWSFPLCQRLLFASPAEQGQQAERLYELALQHFNP